LKGADGKLSRHVGARGVLLGKDQRKRHPLGKANCYERFAARFAAKEAGMKALGTGWRRGLTWRDLEVTNFASGRPALTFHGKAAEIAERLGVHNVSLSITHTAGQAMAMVILED
jgi:holo-[acyl-carrier protein] synthase